MPKKKIAKSMKKISKMLIIIRMQVQLTHNKNFMKMFSKTKMISLLRKTSKRKDGKLKELHGKVIIHEKDIKDEDHEIQKDKGFEAEDNLHVLDDERESSIVRSQR